MRLIFKDFLDNEEDLKNNIQSESQLISNTRNLLLEKKVDSKSFVKIKLDLTFVEKTIRKILDEVNKLHICLNHFEI
jgi:hypothetical protein